MGKILLLLGILLLPTTALADRPFKELLAAAENGDREAMLATGLAYYRGAGVKPDCYEARRWLKNAAGAGEVEAIYRLGIVDDDGNCGLSQAEQAAENFRKAADQGHAGAAFRLGELYRSGRGVDRDTDQAIRWLEKAAARNDFRAYCSLAVIYAKGDEFKPNRPKAQALLRRGLASRSPEVLDHCREIRGEAGL